MSHLAYSSWPQCGQGPRTIKAKEGEQPCHTLNLEQKIPQRLICTRGSWFRFSGGLVYGWPLSGPSWEKQIKPLLDAGHRVVTYDRRGFGNSSKSADGYNYDVLAADLNRLLTKLEFKEAALRRFLIFQHRWVLWSASPAATQRYFKFRPPSAHIKDKCPSNSPLQLL